MTAFVQPDLEQFVPLNTLSEEHLQQIQNGVRTEQIPAAKQLVATDEHRWLVYLVDGELSVKDRNGKYKLCGRSAEARNPVFDHAARSAQAKALTPSCVARVDKQMLQVLLEKQESASTVVEEFDMDDAGEALFRKVYQAYVDRKLRLPGLPDAAMKIREVVKNPDLGLVDISRIVQTDPVLTTRLIQIANSPVYRGEVPVNSALAAVTRLGSDTTQNLAFVMVVSKLFKSNSSVLKQRMSELYDYSALLAASCFVIASRCENLDKEQAMLLGLVSHIGAIPIIHYASQNPTVANEKHLIDNILRNMAHITTGLVLNQWGFDKQFVSYCEKNGKSRSIELQQAINYGDILLAAQLMSPTCFLGSEQSPVEYDNHPLQQKLSAAGIIESQESFRAETSDELQRSYQLLKI